MSLSRSPGVKAALAALAALVLGGCVPPFLTYSAPATHGRVYRTDFGVAIALAFDMSVLPTNGAGYETLVGYRVAGKTIYVKSYSHARLLPASAGQSPTAEYELNLLGDFNGTCTVIDESNGRTLATLDPIESQELF